MTFLDMQGVTLGICVLAPHVLCSSVGLFMLIDNVVSWSVFSCIVVIIKNVELVYVVGSTDYISTLSKQ